ncbi:MAG: 3-hydroxyacyl-ACP dehydratase FabZ [Alphaproteobacteria bacterium]|nr:3-hydroxyacyl-ACP dehydratase FabZ [Alphaproteobacteria bacterium]
MKKFTKKDIENIIPHRGSMLLIDEVRDLTPTSGTGIRRVQSDEFWCAGHFPGKPIMPGVIQLESMAQTACFVILKDLFDKTGNKGFGFFTNIDKCKFVKMVQPGDILELKVELAMQKLTMHKFRGQAFVKGELACEATFSAIMQLS